MKVVDSRIIEKVRGLGLPDGEYAVFGSGLMEVTGIREGGDIDLIVTKKQFDNMDDRWERFVYENNGDEAVRYKGDDFDVAFYYCNYFGLSEEEVERMIGEAVLIDGVRFVTLEDAIVWKERMGREKDLKDVEMIKEYLEENT